MARLSAALARRLDALCNPRHLPRVLVVPRILPPDEWEALAVLSQDSLARVTMEGVGPDRHTLPMAAGRDPMDATERYKPDPTRPPQR